MPLNEIRSQAAEALAAALEAEFDHRPDEIYPSRYRRGEIMGDLAWPGALPLAKVLRKAPRLIAEAVASRAEWPPEVVRVEIAGPGFLNLWIDRRQVLCRLIRDERSHAVDAAVKTRGPSTPTSTPTRPPTSATCANAVLGDVLVRCLGHLEHEVETQNYIDDTGVQVADVVVGLLFLPEAEVARCLGVEPVRRDELVEAALALDPGGVPEATTDDFDDFFVGALPAGDGAVWRRRGVQDPPRRGHARGGGRPRRA